MFVIFNCEWVWLYELVYQWFGDQVMLVDWVDIWLSEGFVIYVELLWVESQGEDGQVMVVDWYVWLLVLFSCLLCVICEEEIFDVSVYFCGVLVLYVLWLKVGDVVFG